MQRILQSICAMLATVFMLIMPAAAQGISGAGTWTGVYQSGSSLVRMTINLRDAAAGQGALEGDIRFDPFNAQKTASVPMGVVQATAKLNPVSRTFDISPGRDAYRTLGMLTPTFTGVVHSGGKLVAGVLAGQRHSQGSHFVLARAGSGEAKELDSMLRSLDRRSDQAGKGILGQLGFGGSGKFSEKKLREWGGQYMREYPNTDAYRMTGDAVMTTAVHLYRDSYFRPFFGKSFDELSNDELLQMEEGMGAFTPPRGAYPEERINGLILSMKYIVRPGVGSSATGYGLSVLAMRLIESWRNDLQAQAIAAGPSVDSWRMLAEAEVAERAFFEGAWPAERKAFADAIAQSRTRLADGLVKFEVDRFMTDNMSRDPQQVNAIISALGQQVSRAPATGRGVAQVANVALFTTEPGVGNPEPALRVAAPYASRDLITQQTARLRQQLTSAVGAQCDGDKQGISRFPGGLAGLEASAKFYREASSRYSQGNGSCDFQPVLQQARTGMWVSAEANLMQRVGAARSEGELNAISSSYLGVPTDNYDPVGQRVISLLSKRQGEFRAIAAQQAAADADLKRQGICASMSTFAEGGEPSEKDMCNAINDQMQAKMARIDGLADNCNNIDGNPTAAMMCLFGGTIRSSGGLGLSVGGFQKIACVSAAAQGKPGYFCDYALKTSSNNAALAPITNGGGGSLITARFVKGPNGWLYFP